MKFEDRTWEGSAIQRSIGFDESERKIILQSSQPNMQECLDFNKAMFNAERSTTLLSPGDGWTKVASVPLWLIEKWRLPKKFGGLELDYFNPEHQPRLLALFNSSEYADLRTAPGRL